MNSWSPATRTLWAKSGPPMVPLVTHLDDAATVAELLWERYVPVHTKNYLAQSLQVEPEQAKRLVLFLASIHDVGKATPDFQVKVPELAEKLHPYGIKPYLNAGEAYRKRSHHSTTGQYITEEWLKEHAAVPFWADVVGAHHGKGQHQDILYRVGRRPGYEACAKELLGNDKWTGMHQEILQHFWELFRMEDNPAIKVVPTSSVLMLVTGFVIFTDWVASNTEYFNGEDLDDPNRTANSLARVAIPQQWNPQSIPSFEERFGFAPYVSQQSIAAMMVEKVKPGLWIIESSMGTGKTESALLGAEIFAHKFKLHGMVFALPNRASANSIFKRFIEWMGMLPETDLALTAPVYLAHGKASLNDDYLKATGEKGIDEDGADGSSVRSIAKFFKNPKTYPMVPMMVSTVDHVLMAGLDAKHQMLRHFAYAGKVVVVDEIHAYGAFMNTFFDKALQAFGEYQVPVILLSATLPPKRRAELVKAYSGVDSNEVANESGYPLVTYASHDGDVDVRSFDSPREGTPYHVEHVVDEHEDILAKAKQVTDLGGNVLIIRNTVNRAKETYELVHEQYGEKSLLLHSRFIPADRERIEKNLTQKFSSKAKDRESGWVCVATQVAEQSLDIDFDYLITDLAPVDLILQRLGRVFRNPKAAGRAVDDAAVAIVDIDAKNMFACLPYHPWTMRQAEWVLEGLGTVVTPDHVPGLVRKAYEDDQFPELWDKLKHEEMSARRMAGTNALNVFSKERLLDIGMNEANENRVRDIEDQHEVVLLEDIDGKVCLPSWLPADLAPGKPVAGYLTPQAMKGIGASTMSLSGRFLKLRDMKLGTVAEWAKFKSLKDTKVFVVRKASETIWESGGVEYSLEEGLS